MAKYRHKLPQLEGGLFLSDGGIETTLLFREGLDLPDFAVFPLLEAPSGRDALRRYFTRHASIARDLGTGFILESATWRANPDWGHKLGYGPQQLRDANRAAIELLVSLRDELETAATPMVISGCVGPRGDGYDPGAAMTAEEAERYHAEQIGVFAGTEADLVTAITMTNAPEAVGLARAAREAQMPSAVALTVETDGTLPTGQPLGEAVEQIDAETDRAPAYYMINCAHPTHFDSALTGAPWVERLRGLRANASTRSHAELDEATELDDGDPHELGRQYAELMRRLPHLNVLGGCCGTDHRHIEEIGRACASR
ncbi:MAG: homocysteine S-methyltransferase family protein [Proteobacteria bacterium]|nr:homocysteine S-methyltransferase family protein [Pseudomonadota bacterium]